MSELDPEAEQFIRRIRRAVEGGDRLLLYGGGGIERWIGELYLCSLVSVGGSIKWGGITSRSLVTAADSEGTFFEVEWVNKNVEILSFDREKVRKYTPLLYPFGVLDELAEV